jgi:hypothetical protein
VTAKENILAGLTKLLQEGGVAKSACSAALLGAIRSLLDTGVVVEERSGAGRRLVVRNVDALRWFVERYFPNREISDDHLSRTVGVARFRDSKTFASDTPEIVHVRAWTDEALLKDGKPAGAAQATSDHGVFSFLLSKHYSLRGTCALVESPAVFIQFERVHLSAGLVIWYSGCVSGRLLDWLAGNNAPDFSLVHLPDYDPVGMNEFTRLRARLDDRVSLHLPDNLEEQFLLPDCGILKKGNNRAMLANLRKSKLAEVRRVVALMDGNNGCLEQESLLLPAETN